MSKPRRRKEGMSHSISCTDEEWEMIRNGAARNGMAASAWFVQCALNVNPRSKRALPLVLDETQQRDMVDAVERLAGTISRDPETLFQIADDVRHLLRERVRAMTRQGRSTEARARLREVFGAEHARWIEDWAQRPGVDRPEETEGRPAAAADRAGETASGPTRRAPWHALRAFMSALRRGIAGNAKP